LQFPLLDYLPKSISALFTRATQSELAEVLRRPKNRNLILCFHLSEMASC